MAGLRRNVASSGDRPKSAAAGRVRSGRCQATLEKEEDMIKRNGVIAQTAIDGEYQLLGFT